jgi:hypothetical protein
MKGVVFSPKTFSHISQFYYESIESQEKTRREKGSHRADYIAICIYL